MGGAAIASKLNVSLHSEWRLVGLATCFMMGIASYFAFDMTPPIIVYLVLFIFLACLPFVVPMLRHISWIGVLIVLFGHGYAFYRAELIETAFIERRQFFEGTAIVGDIDERSGGFHRIIFYDLMPDSGQLSNLKKIQLNVRTKIQGGILPGDRVAFSAVLEPPSGKVSLTGYDFRRAAYFKTIQATGFTTTSLTAVNSVSTTENSVNRIRFEIATYLSNRIDGDAGKLAAALLVGKRGALSRDVVDDMRASGLAHMLAISGLHMGLFVTASFFVLESLLLLIPSLSRRYDCRKIAAVGALITATIYLSLSGFGMATIRAYIITIIALLAILLDRRVVSLRSLAIAAILMLILTPEAILGAGFQMSFSATAALVVFYETLRKKRQKIYEEGGDYITRSKVSRVAHKIANFFLFTCITTIIAQFAVAPFALIHFQSVSLYGLLANIIAVPALLFIVVPSAFASALSALFGLELLFLPILEWGLSQIITVAAYVADIDGGVLLSLPSLFYTSVLCLVFGTALLVFQGNRYISAALFFAFICTPLIFTQPRPDLIIGQNARAVAYQMSDNEKLTMVAMRKGGFLYQNMQQQWGMNDRDILQGRWSCDSEACLLKDIGLSHVFSMLALRQECTVASIVIIDARWKRFCRGDAIKLSKETLSRYGPVYIYNLGQTSNEIPTAKWVNPVTGSKPWQ